MKNFTKQKSIVAFLLSMVITLSVFPSPASALFGVGIPVLLDGETNAEALIDEGAIATAAQPCLIAAKAITVAKAPVGFVARALDAISEGAAGIAADLKTTGLISTAQTECAASRTIIQNLGFARPALTSIQRHAKAIEQITGIEEELTNMQQEIDAHHSLSQKTLWKAVFTKVFLNVSQSLVTRMVSKLNNVYKINDFGKYADAIGTTIYQAQRIKGATDDNVEQAMINSMITDNAFANQIHPAAIASAKLALNFDPGEVTFNDPQLLDKIFSLSLSKNNALDVDLAMRQASSLVVGNAQKDALTEISQSSYKSPRTCNQGLIEEQEQFNSNYAKRATESQELYQEYSNLYNQYIKGSSDVTPEDLSDFKNAYLNSLTTLNDLPKKSPSAVLVACGAITSPAEFIAGRVGTMLDNFAKNISDPKTDNFPVAISAVANIASNFASKLILGIGEGGSSGKSNVINEDAKLASGNADDINYQTENAGDPAGETQSQIKLDYTRGSKEGEITITWDASERKNAESVRLQGPGIGTGGSDRDQPSTILKDSYTTTITEDSTFTLTVYVSATAKNPEPKVKTLKVPLVDPNINTRGDDGTQPDGGPGQVQGVFQRVSIQPRGPILPRN